MENLQKYQGYLGKSWSKWGMITALGMKAQGMDLFAFHVSG